MSELRTFMSHDAILDLVDGMSYELKKLLQDENINDPSMIGIHTGGAWIANHLHQKLEIR